MLLRPSKASFPFIWYASSVQYSTCPYPSVKFLSTSTRSSSSIFVSSFHPTTSAAALTSRIHPDRNHHNHRLGTSTTSTARNSIVVGCNQRSTRLISSTTSSMASSSAADTDADTEFLKEQVIVSIDDAIKLHGKSNVKFVDGSWFLKGRNGKEEFITGPRIKDSIYFDIDDIATSHPANLPHMMPPKKLFNAAMDSCNISNNDHIIVYGSKDCMFVHRAWFQIRNMGHGNEYTHLLDGSIDDWMKGGGETEKYKLDSTSIDNRIPQKKNLDTTKSTSYQATDPQYIVDLDEMKSIVTVENDDNDWIVVDVRSNERFLGQVEEPRPNMRLGHMPNARNIFFLNLLNSPDNVNQLKATYDLQKIIQDEGGIDLSKLENDETKIISSCGSGATACTLVAALTVCGVPMEKCYLYDGSWSEWGSLPDTPIVNKDGQLTPANSNDDDGDGDDGSSNKKARTE